MKQVCFYHAGCPDGFGSAWAVRNAWGDTAKYVPLTHGDPVEVDRFEGDLVVFADIIPDNQVLTSLGQRAAEVIVLDHHISSLERYRSDLATVNAMEADGHQIHFDLSHSGAVLSWEFFCADEAVPDLLLYVEDQDLWNWKLPRSREVNAAIGSYPMRFESWTELAGRPIEELAEEGAPIVRANEAEVRRVLHHSHPCRIGERRVQAVNSSYVRAAIGHALAEEAAFELQWGLVYRLRGDMVLITLYSIGDLDVSAVAAEYGGGGHRNAAGFNVSLERWLNDFA